MKKFLIVILVLLTTILISDVCKAEENNENPLFQLQVVDSPQTYVDVVITPGEQTTFSIVLTNVNSTPLTNRLYISDSFTDNNGGTLMLTPEEAVLEKAGSWINIIDEIISLDANESKVIDFVVSAPSDIAVGTHVAVLYLTSFDEDNHESNSDTDRISFQINEVFAHTSSKAKLQCDT